jgi:CrcB protein
VNNPHPGVTGEASTEEDAPDGHHAEHGGNDRHIHELPVDPDVPQPSSAARARRRTPRLLRERWDILLVIAAGGALGSLGRWSLTVALPHAPDQVPWATGLANVSGALVLGALMVLILDVWPPSRYVRPFLGVGVLGGYTTFSTYMLDSRTLLTSGHPAVAFGYLIGSVLTGLAAVWAGVLLTRTAVAGLERRHLRRHEREHDPDLDQDADADLRSRR